MTRREKLIQAAALFAATFAAAFLARYGVVIPPPVVPPPVVTITPPVAPPPRPADADPDPTRAIARIQFGNAGCTATVIGPRREDGKWWVLTASHCVSQIGQTGSMRMLDGRTFVLRAIVLDRTSDCCWCETSRDDVSLPFALLADRSPDVGARVWHAGYGVDRPGNREEGTVAAPPNADGQIQMKLSVSSGDSGGGICLTTDGRVVSCVCCTTSRGNLADVWGASVESIRKLQPTTHVWDEWTPVDVPTRMPPGP